MSISTVSVGESTKKSWPDEVISFTDSLRSDLTTLSSTVMSRGTTIEASASSSVAAGDGVGTVIVTPSTATASVAIPAASDDDGRELLIMKSGTGAGYIQIWATIESAGKEFTLFELAQDNDFIKIKSDGTNWIKINPPYWHSIINPSVGWKVQYSAAWTADVFGGHILDLAASLPAGALKTTILYNQTTNTNAWYNRALNDSNISDTPSAANERSHMMGAGIIASRVELWLDINRQTEFASSHADVDLDISYPSDYLQ